MAATCSIPPWFPRDGSPTYTAPTRRNSDSRRLWLVSPKQRSRSACRGRATKDLSRSHGPAIPTSTADLKFLHHLPQTHPRNFRSKSGTRIIDLLVPSRIRSSCKSVLQRITNFGCGALDRHLPFDPRFCPIGP